MKHSKKSRYTEHILIKWTFLSPVLSEVILNFRFWVHPHIQHDTYAHISLSVTSIQSLQTDLTLSGVFFFVLAYSLVFLLNSFIRLGVKNNIKNSLTLLGAGLGGLNSLCAVKLNFTKSGYDLYLLHPSVEGRLLSVSLLSTSSFMLLWS